MTGAVRPRWGVPVALGTVYVVWGSVYLAIALVVEHAPPFTSMGGRFVVAGVLLAAVLALAGGPRRLLIDRRQFLALCFMGTALLALGNGLTSIGQHAGVSSGGAALLVASAPMWIALFRTVSGDRPPWLGLVGVVIGFAGLLVLVLGGGTGVGPLPVKGVVLILISSAAWSFGSWIRPRLPLPPDPFVGAVYQLLIAGTLLLVGAVISGERANFDLGASGWGALTYLVVIVSIGAFSAYTWLLQNAPISLVSTHAYVNPVVAVLLGWLILAEPVTSAVWVGGGIVVAAVVLVVWSERRKAPPGGLPPRGEGDTPVGG